MKKVVITLLIVYCMKQVNAQETIPLNFESIDNIAYTNEEKQYFSKEWQTEVITNVQTPTLQVFTPEKGKSNGTSVIIAPGGGLFALSINSEGYDVARWLSSKGITAFVLKYRLVPTGHDGVKEYSNNEDPEKLYKRVKQVLPFSIDDGLTAIEYVRTNAAKYNLDPHKIGFIGFSAGGAVTMGVTFNYTKTNRPNFIVPVYPWMVVLNAYTVPTNAPPMLVICASDDPLQLAPASVNLYSNWLSAKKTTELHMYSKGGHGFGMRTQNLPSDHWIERFYDWAKAENLISPE